MRISFNNMHYTKNDCLICERIALIKKGNNPHFVIELDSTYVVLGDHQFYKGYTLLLSKIHTPELHLLPSKFKQKLLMEVSIVGEAVYKTFYPNKLNYELLGNEVQHIHWHLFPRYLDDPNISMPVWTTNKRIRNSNKYMPTPQQLNLYKKGLLKEIKLLYPNK